MWLCKRKVIEKRERERERRRRREEKGVKDGQVSQ